MNKYLLLSAAAVFAGTTAAGAGTYCFAFGTGGGSYCDGGRVTTGVDGGDLNGAVRAWVHTNANCSGGTSQGYGFLSKVPGLGKVSNMSDTFYAKYYGNFSTAVSYTLPKSFNPFGSKYWSLWIGMNGVTFFEALSGVLIRNGKCQNPAASHSRKSTLDAVKALLAEHRNAKVRS